MNNILKSIYCSFSSSNYSRRSHVGANFWLDVYLRFVENRFSLFLFRQNDFLGSKYSNDCPIQPLLIIYHLIGGGVGSLFWLWSMLRALRRRRQESGIDDDDDTDIDAHLGDSSNGQRLKDNGIWFMELLAFVFLLICFSFGNYWTWSIFWPAEDMTETQPTNWCNHSLYIFTLVSIGIIYLLFIFVILFVFSFLIFARVCVRVLIDE